MSTYPHVRDNRSTPAISFCACGASAVSATTGPASWGDDCPRLMREALDNTAVDLAALRLEHEAWGAIIDATRADRDRAREQVAGYRDIHGRIRDALGGDVDIAVENLARAVVAERDAARAEVAKIRDLLDAHLNGWSDATTPHPDQPEMGPMPTLIDGVARALEDLTLARGEVAGLRDRIAYLEAGLGALVRHNAGTGACLPDCITNTDDGEDCNCGYMAAEDPGGFAADLLSGLAEVISERGAAGAKS